MFACQFPSSAGPTTEANRKQQDTSANRRPSVACIICLCFRTPSAIVNLHFLFKAQVALYSLPRQLIPKMLKWVVSTTMPSASPFPLQFLSSLAPNPLLGSKLPPPAMSAKMPHNFYHCPLHQTAHHHVLDHSLPNHTTHIQPNFMLSRPHSFPRAHQRIMGRIRSGSRRTRTSF